MRKREPVSASLRHWLVANLPKMLKPATEETSNERTRSLGPARGERGRRVGKDRPGTWETRSGRQAHMSGEHRAVINNRVVALAGSRRGP